MSTAEPTSDAARPASGTGPDDAADLTIGVDIGGTKVLGGVVTPDGEVLVTARRDTPADNVGKTLDFIVEVITELVHKHSPRAIGIGAAGWIDESRSRVHFAPNLAWRDEPLRERIADRVGLPVVVENDANAAAWAEFRFGAAREVPAATGGPHPAGSMALFTVGTGIGGGLVVGGRLWRGGHGMAAEMGHMRVVPGGRLCGCGRTGCLEQYASGSALVRAAREGASNDPESARRLLELAGGDVAAINGPAVTKAAREGDPVARHAFAEVGRWLGSAMADIVQLLDIDVVVVGGGVVEAGELLLAPARAEFVEQLAARSSLPVAPVLPARMGNLAGVVGAADLARH